MLRSAIMNEISEERYRQIAKERFDESHDDDLHEGELGAAAAAYADPSPESYDSGGGRLTPTRWPFNPMWYKPKTDRRRELIIAGALIVAEIERLDRRKL